MEGVVDRVDVSLFWKLPQMTKLVDSPERVITRLSLASLEPCQTAEPQESFNIARSRNDDTLTNLILPQQPNKQANYITPCRRRSQDAHWRGKKVKPQN